MSIHSDFCLPQSLRDLLENPSITDLCFNRWDQLYVDRGNGLEKIENDPTLFESESAWKAFVLEHISLSGKTWDAKLPFLDTIFFQTHRAHIAFPPLAQYGIYLSLRRLPRSTSTSPQSPLFNTRWIESEIAFEILKKSIDQEETIIIAGGTGSGKTTLLNDLLSFVSPTARMIALEDTPEIAPAHPHFLSLISRSANADGFGSVTLKDLLRQTLRMRPDRILIGECRGDEVLDLLQALNTGHRGTLGTIHANSARDALRRIELLALIASRGTVPSPLIRELLANGIQKLVFLERLNGKRKIKTILQIEGFEREIIFTRPIFAAPEFAAIDLKHSEIRKGTAIAVPQGST